LYLTLGQAAKEGASANPPSLKPWHQANFPIARKIRTAIRSIRQDSSASIRNRQKRMRSNSRRTICNRTRPAQLRARSPRAP